MYTYLTTFIHYNNLYDHPVPTSTSFSGQYCPAAANTTDQSSPLLQLPTNSSGGGGRKAKVASCYIRQMSEANLLISAEQIQLMDSVGQG